MTIIMQKKILERQKKYSTKILNFRGISFGFNKNSNVVRTLLFCVPRFQHRLRRRRAGDLLHLSTLRTKRVAGLGRIDLAESDRLAPRCRSALGRLLPEQAVDARHLSSLAARNGKLHTVIDPACPVNADGYRDLGTWSNKRYVLYWNVAVDEPIANTKTINMIVAWRVKDSEGGWQQVSFTTVKAEEI